MLICRMKMVCKTYLPSIHFQKYLVIMVAGYFVLSESEVILMAKGKYEYWLTPEGLQLLEGWARDGLTDEQVAKNMDINKATLYRWKDKHCDICNALKNGKEVVDRQVENALLKRALGYEYTEVKTKKENDIVTEVTTTTKQVVPDVTAQIFWLKNRKPEAWRDKVVYTDEKDHVKDWKTAIIEIAKRRKEKADEGRAD